MGREKPEWIRKVFLVDASSPESLQFEMTELPEEPLAGISFLVGVDSSWLPKGPQTGALDPLRGMFWMWNTGYIFFKLEGKSPASSARGHLLEYHIGGFRPPHNCLRRIGLNPQKPVKKATSGNQTVTIGVDVNQLFNQSSPLDFKAVPTVTDFRHATEIADQFQAMFNWIVNE